MTKNCIDCGNSFDITVDPMLEPVFSRMLRWCPECTARSRDATKKAEQERINRQREAEWNKICPPGYRDTEIEKLPNPDKVAEVMAWNYGPAGLLLHGVTRRGKSRCAWLVARKVFDAGKSVRVLDSMAGFQFAATFTSSPGDALEWINDYSRCGLLFLDDVFKVKLTEAFEAAVFAIVENRMAHKLPILATLNDTGETLTARMSADRGEALIARLREMCEVIRF